MGLQFPLYRIIHVAPSSGNQTLLEPNHAHDPLILVPWRHTWSCSPGSPSMWEVSCGPNELCCHGTTQPNRSPDWHSTHSGSKSGKTTPQQEHQSPSASNPLMTWWENSLIGSLDLANSQVNIRYECSPDAHLVIHAPRKFQIALRPKVKEHLPKMEALGVITHTDQPTDWVSSITYILKANGELCLCLDPHDLNRAICCKTTIRCLL